MNTNTNTLNSQSLNFCTLTRGTKLLLNRKHYHQINRTLQFTSLNFFICAARNCCIQLQFRDVLGTYLSPETAYLEGLLVSSLLQTKCRVSTLKLGHDRFLTNPYHFINTYHPFIRSHILNY
jgi:hypothetical protein